MEHWRESKKELPECDGLYEVCNQPDLENDPYRSDVGISAYDGYGFTWLGIYRIPKFWRPSRKFEKKYGKQTN